MYLPRLLFGWLLTWGSIEEVVVWLWRERLLDLVSG
jgi:hypothetical protein